MSQKLRYFSLCLITALIVISHYQPISAQFDDFIFVCVQPIPATERDPFLIGIRNTGVNNTGFFGLIFPEPVRVMVYSYPHIAARVARFGFEEDAETGGYIRDSEATGASILDAGANGDIPDGKMCTGRFHDLLTDEFWLTSSMVTNSRQMLLIQAGANDPQLLFSEPIRGVIALDFLNMEQDAPPFQLIQMAGGPIDVYLPYIPDNQNVPMMLSANKNITMRRSQEFDSAAVAAAGQKTPGNRATLILDLQREFQLDLYERMEAQRAHIFPVAGLLDNYPGGGLIRIEISSIRARRGFEENQPQQIRVRPRDGMTVPYYHPGNLSPEAIYGTLKTPESTATVIRAGDDGYLVVRDPEGTGEVLIKARLVEIVP